MFSTARQELKLLARDPILLALLAIIAASIALFVVYPLAKVFLASVQVDGQWTLSEYLSLGQRRLYRNALVNSLGVAVENLSASESRIRDADIAALSSEMVAAQILQQAGVSVLSQANQTPQAVLQLLQG